MIRTNPRCRPTIDCSSGDLTAGFVASVTACPPPTRTRVPEVDMSQTVESPFGTNIANLGSQCQMCGAHGSKATAARSVSILWRRSTVSWWRRIASLPVVRMSLMVTGPAFHHDETSPSVSSLKSDQSSYNPRRRRTVSERPLKRTVAGSRSAGHGMSRRRSLSTWKLYATHSKKWFHDLVFRPRRDRVATFDGSHLRSLISA